MYRRCQGISVNIAIGFFQQIISKLKPLLNFIDRNSKYRKCIRLKEQKIKLEETFMLWNSNNEINLS